MAEFLSAYKRTEKYEGGYVNDPFDRGGETYKGIARKFHPKWGGWGIIDEHKPISKRNIFALKALDSEVKLFYNKNFWQPIKGDLIDEQEVADFVYDWHVNSGRKAIIIIQRTLGLVDDGVVGTATLGALNSLDGSATLISARRKFYSSIVANNPSQRRFLKGWLARVDGFA